MKDSGTGDEKEENRKGESVELSKYARKRREGKKRRRRLDSHPSEDRQTDVDPEISEDSDFEEDWERWDDAVEGD